MKKDKKVKKEEPKTKKTKEDSLNQTQEHNGKKFLHEKYFFLISLLIIFLLIPFAISHLTKKTTENLEETSFFLEDAKYVGKLEDKLYYIADANQNIAFKVAKNSQRHYKITDSENKEIKTKMKKINNDYYIVNKNGYQAGEEYTLTLDENIIEDERLKDAEKIIFKITQEEVETYEWKDNVKELDRKDLKIKNNQLDISNLDIQKDNIIIVKENNRYLDAYKITDITNNLASIDETTIDAIYESLEIYKKIKPNFDEMTLYNKDGQVIAANTDKIEEQKIDEYIVRNVKEEVVDELPAIKFLKNEAQKTNNKVTNNIDFKKEGNKLTFIITLSVKANGEKFMGINALKEHDLNMTFTFDISLDILLDMQKGKNINLAATITEKMNFDINLKSSIYHEGFSSLDDTEYDKTIEDIIKRIEKGNPDSASGRATIGALELPTSIPGLNIYFDLYFQTDTKLLLNASYNQSLTESQTIGLATINGNLQPYFYETSPEITFNFDMSGSANTKLGVGLDIGLSVINKNIANVNIGEEIGFYGDAFATLHADYDSSKDIEDINTYTGGLIDLGVYLEVKMNSNVNFLFLKQSKSIQFVDEKKSLFKIGTNEITTGIEPKVDEIDLRKNKSVSMPITYQKILDISTGKITKKPIKVNKLKYTNEQGEDLTKTKINFNGKNEFTVNITYEENNRMFKTKVKLIKDTNTNLSQLIIELTPQEETAEKENTEPKEENNNTDQENKQPEEEKNKLIKVSQEEAMKFCKDNFAKEQNGVTLSCIYANVIKSRENEDANLNYAFYVIASDDPWTNGLTNFYTSKCKYGYYYTTVFVPTEYYEKNGLHALTGWWFEDYNEQDYIGTVTWPTVMN